MKTKDDEEVLRDGQVRRFPMQFMDGARRELAERARRSQNEPMVTDGMGGTAGLQRPGYRLPAPGSALDHAGPSTEARARYLKDINESWQPKPAA